MCKGAEEKNVAPLASTRGSASCDLCGLKASLYCQADNAYLCGKCDNWVHKANVLALRHVRCFLCNTCQNLTQRYLIGVSVEIVLPPTVRWIVQKQDLPNNNNDRYVVQER
uniref:Zinc finger protein CONSTANS-LIKE 3 n=1 Tax=Cajanus cajan TaxID=3821 RepID=A0A151S690_CAJCA|nr:Zinc finger protein CONSTANS-LIKE 3 [Cajanus cajan]